MVVDWCFAFVYVMLLMMPLIFWDSQYPWYRKLLWCILGVGLYYAQVTYFRYHFFSVVTSLLIPCVVLYGLCKNVVSLRIGVVFWMFFEMWQLVQLMMSMQVGLMYEWLVYAVCIILKLMCDIVFVTWLQKNKQWISFIKENSWMCFVMIVMVVMMRHHLIQNAYWLRVLLALLVVFSCFAWYQMHRYYSQMMIQEHKELVSKAMLLTQKQMQSFQQTNREIRSIRHEMKTLLLTIDHLLHENKTDEARKYIEASIHTINQTVIKTYTPLPYLNALLNHVLSEYPNIILHVDAHIDEQIPFDPLDISMIVYNMLENAIQEVTEKHLDPNITFKLHQNHGFLVVEMINALATEKSLHTTKPDFINHGFGIDMMKKIAMKYHGNVEIKQDAYFIIRVLLVMDSELPRHL